MVANGKEMILNGWLVRFWRGPPRAGGPDLDMRAGGSVLPVGGLTWRGLTPVAVGGWVKSEGKSPGRQGPWGPMRGLARAPHTLPPPLFFIVLLVGADVAARVTSRRQAPFATNLHRTTRLLLRIKKYGVLPIYPSGFFSSILLTKTGQF